MAENTLVAKLDQSTERCLNMDAPLADRLRILADDIEALSPEFADIVRRMIQHLRDVGAGLKAPAIGEDMPSFILPDQAGRLVALDDVLVTGPAVIAFHRGHWCPYCRMNADALSKLQTALTPGSATIVAITPNISQFNREFAETANATFSVLTDLDNGYALQLGLAFRVPEEKRRAMISSGYNLPGCQSNDAWMLPIPATFVVAQDGTVRARFVDPDYRLRMAIEDIQDALDQIGRGSS